MTARERRKAALEEAATIWIDGGIGAIGLILLATGYRRLGRVCLTHAIARVLYVFMVKRVWLR